MSDREPNLARRAYSWPAIVACLAGGAALSAGLWALAAMGRQSEWAAVSGCASWLVWPAGPAAYFLMSAGAGQAVSFVVGGAISWAAVLWALWYGFAVRGRRLPTT
jgi:hypothetical protein